MPRVKSSAKINKSLAELRAKHATSKMKPLDSERDALIANLRRSIKSIDVVITESRSTAETTCLQNMFDSLVFRIWNIQTMVDMEIPKDILRAVERLNQMFRDINEDNGGEEILIPRKIGDVREEPDRVDYDSFFPDEAAREKGRGAISERKSKSPEEERVAARDEAHAGAGGGRAHHHVPGGRTAAAAEDDTIEINRKLRESTIKDTPKLKVSDDSEILDFGDGVKVIAHMETVGGERVITHLTPVVESAGDGATMEPLTVTIPRKVHGRNSKKFFDVIEFRWVEALEEYVVYAVTLLDGHGDTGESQFTGELIAELIALTANWNEDGEYIGEQPDGHAAVAEARDGFSDDEGDDGEENREEVALSSGNVIVAIKNEHGQVTNLYIEDVDTDEEHKEITVKIPRLDAEGNQLDIIDEVVFRWDEEDGEYHIAEFNIPDGDDIGDSQFTDEFIAAAMGQLVDEDSDGEAGDDEYVSSDEEGVDSEEAADNAGHNEGAHRGGYATAYVPPVATPMPSATPTPSYTPTNTLATPAPSFAATGNIVNTLPSPTPSPIPSVLPLLGQDIALGQETFELQDTANIAVLLAGLVFFIESGSH